MHVWRKSCKHLNGGIMCHRARAKQNDVKVIELSRFEDNVKVLTKFEIKGKQMKFITPTKTELKDKDIYLSTFNEISEQVRKYAYFNRYNLFSKRCYGERLTRRIHNVGNTIAYHYLKCVKQGINVYVTSSLQLQQSPEDGTMSKDGRFVFMKDGWKMI